MENALTSGQGSNYRWYILTLLALTFAFCVAMPMSSMPVLFKEISDDLDLSLVQIGTVWGMVGLGGMLFILIGGLLGDRFGVKCVLSVACLLTGLAGALRGLSGNFIHLAATTLLLGLPTAVIIPNVPKTCGTWFPGRQLGLANAVAGLGMGGGIAVGAMINATILSPLLGGWRNVVFLYGAISIAISFLWLLARSKPSQFESSASYASTVPFRQALSRVAHIRNVWLLGFIVLGKMGCSIGISGYLPLYLRKIGWAAASADGTLAALNVAATAAGIPIALLSDRLGSRKAILFAATLVTTISVGLLSVASGLIVWVLVIMVGIVRDGFMAVLNTMIMETEGVGAIYAGTALGLVMTLSRLGTFVSPPIGNSLSSINLGLPFIFWAALAAVSLFGFHFLKETRGRR